MLEIHTRTEGPPIMCPVELERLLHDVRVVQGVPFLELDDGLLNLAEVVRIIEVSPDTGPVPEYAAQGGIQSTPFHFGMAGDGHSGTREACPVCRIVDGVEAQQVPETADRGLVHDHTGSTCLACAAESPFARDA